MFSNLTDQRLVSFLVKISLYLLPILRIQLFVTLLAMPILVSWGLAISSLTIFGNIIFAPLLIIFLSISSLIFFLEILYLPNQWLIYLLEKLTWLWLKIQPPCPQQWLLCFPQATWVIFLAAFTLAIYLISLKISKLKQVLCLSLILLVSLLFAKLGFWIKTDQIELKHRRAKLLIIYQPNGSLIMHDYGILNQHYGIQNWLCYQLLPTLIKKFGTLTIQDLYLHKSQNQFTNTNLALIKQNLNLKMIHQK